ncbi:bifunctional 3-demethylubiquinone-9 3-methyltransferase/ 2-octaprenyl-6-hydroxy phenol methylase [Variovorax sp. SRS16]|uniref:methyltransferase regulatory domain-containing protein n=1 Tax=Variovorax sp. SRS16 TaxID=282217 RepID=UPI00131776D6|nr:class I SAM-dependent methyltransferase [Variovorax sp. SRS16]VTU15622.1 bifunctional 3-demethylubiquinone-9 3-methyltransferase/ 2-octaprenyl-6-hydroxy phenol methylase [Variovorax sp. SRS16]
MDSVTTALTSYYDTVPYDSHPFPQASVEHLEALAFLFGLRSPPPEKARVLELGCAAGGNLIPLAARHPDLRATGVDLSQVQVRQGATAIAQARLMNIELRAFNIADIDASFGEFDYIICHGVYSWVPQPVQDAILRVCAQNLAPDGVAYVSYNVYPGWKAREIVRDAMILRGAPRDEPDEKLSYARGMLEFLEQSARPDSVLKKTLEENMPLVRSANKSYLLHEFLEPCNAPCYFKEFVARAGAHGLSYLADAEPSSMFVQNYGDKVREPLLRECGGSQIMMEQYLDFLVNRTFRQTLLVKQDRATDIRYRLDPERIRALEFAGTFAAVDGRALTLDAVEQPCHAIRKLNVTLRLPVHKAVAQVLDERYPATVSIDALVASGSARTGEPRAAVEPVVMAMLEQLLILGAVRIRRSAPQVASYVSEFPRALEAVRGARGLALSTGPSSEVCNQWHEPVGLSMLERCVLPLLDGKHSHDDLAQHLAAEARAERLRFIKDDKPVTDDETLRAFTQEQVALALRDLRRKGLLVS